MPKSFLCQGAAPNQVDRVLPLSTDPGSNLCVQPFPEPSLTEEHINVYLRIISIPAFLLLQ